MDDSCEEAEVEFRRSLAICEATYPPDPPQTRFALTRVQNPYRAWGRTEQADRYLERSRTEGR